MSGNKTLIFISSHKYLSNLHKILMGIKQDKIMVLGPDASENIPADLKDNIPSRTFQEYESSIHNAKVCADEAWGLIKKWGSLRIDENTSFEDLTRYKNISLWRINDIALILYYLADLLYYLKMASSILEKERPGQLVLIGSKFNLIERIFFEIAKEKKIPVEWKTPVKPIRISLPFFSTVLERSYYLLGLEIRICLSLQPYIWGLFLTTALNCLSGKLYNLRFKERPGQKQRNIVFYSSIKKHLDSVIPLVRELAKEANNRVLVIDWFYRSSDAVRLLRKENIPHRAFDGYMTFEICISLWQKSRDFLTKWKLIENNPSLQRQFTYHDIFIWDLLSDYLKELYLRQFVKMSNFFEVAQRIVDMENPHIVIVTNEKEYSARLSVIAAKLKNVPSLALQRGAFADYAEAQGSLYTDKMVVDGKFAYQSLVQREAEPEKLIMAGNPRYDIIKRMNIASSKEKIYKQLDLAIDKRLILLTSMFLNPTYHLTDKKELLWAVFSALKKFPRCHLVVKLHPGQISDRLYRDTIKNVRIENISIIKNLETLELIASCAVIITNHSTTGVDAILMDKPFIFVNPSKINPDWMPYVRSGAALGVYRKEDMEESLVNILENKSTQEKLRLGREKFISWYIQDFDGQATQRISRIIMNMIVERLDTR